MTEVDKERWFSPLYEYYQQKQMNDAEIRKTIERVFTEAQIGWNRAPRDLDTRIKIKSGYQWKSHENLNPKFHIEKETTIEEEVTEDPENYLLAYLSKEEKEWWLKREDKYRQDFDFNSSSDEMLLKQLLAEELIQRRALIKQLKNKDNDYNKMLTEVLKRITEVQAKLGITREQRSGILDNVDGNIASLAVTLEEKLANMPEKMRKEQEEELYYSNLKNQRPPHNILPPIEKIEALLQVDGKVTTNIDSERISEITEQVAKEITDKKHVERIELAEGAEI